MSRPLQKRYGCPVELTVDVLGGKWKIVILARIKDQPLSWSALRRTIPGLSDKVLSEKLSELGALGLIEQARGSVGFDRATYRLTRRGRDLAPALNAMYEAGEQLADDLGITISEPRVLSERVLA